MNNTKTPNGGKYALNSESREILIEDLTAMLDQLDDYWLQVVCGIVKRFTEGASGHVQ